MPIIGFTDLQRRSLQIGELRIGTSVASANGRGRTPKRLDTYRVTTGSRDTAEGAAAIYGGKVAPWSERKGMWEVITDRTELQVWVPPRGEAVDSWMEAWDGPRCLAKCDGKMMVRPERKPCTCPHPADPSDPAQVEAARAKRMSMAAMRPPQACKPMTRYNVSITELPGALGVFKLVTASESAAVESADSGDLLALARKSGIYLPAIARISWRTRVGDGKPYPVPSLQIGASMQQIASGELPSGPAGLLALLAPAASGAPAIGPGRDQLALPASTPGPDAGPAAALREMTGLEPWERAQAIAEAAASARTPGDITALAERAKAEGVIEEHYCSDRPTDTWEPLRPFLEDEYRRLSKEAAA